MTILSSKSQNVNKLILSDYRNFLTNFQNYEICVAVTHLKAKYGFEDVRLNQAHSLVKKINEFTNGKKIL